MAHPINGRTDAPTSCSKGADSWTFLIRPAALSPLHPVPRPHGRLRSATTTDGPYSSDGSEVLLNARFRAGEKSGATHSGARIWRMTAYTFPNRPNESQAQKLRSARSWLIVALVSLSLVALYLSIHSTGRPGDNYKVLFIASFALLANFWSPFGKRSAYKEIAAKYRINSIDIDSDGLRLNGATWSKFIPRDEITQVQEPPNGRGLYVRTRRRFSWYIIPRSADRYEEIRGAFAAMGIPIVQTPAPSRWWGFLFPFLFCASMLCNILTQDRRILVVNFALALILACAGVILTKSFTGDRRLRLQSLLGSFLPAVFAAISLYFPFGLR